MIHILTYLKRDISKKEKRETTKHMQQYNNLAAIIESKTLDLLPSPTSAIKEDPVQESNHFRSQAEDYTFAMLEIDELILLKKKLDIAYKAIRETQRMIWDVHFIDGMTDKQIYENPKNEISRGSYYIEKDTLTRVVSECVKRRTI